MDDKGTVLAISRNKCRADQVLLFAFCVLILVLLVVVWRNSKLEIENAKLKFKNELLQQENQNQYAPSGAHEYDN